MDVLILRLEGPMMSFGAPIVDNRGAIQDHPSLSMLTGLIGNALGYRHGDFDRLQRLQERIRFGARCDRPGERFTDYQTVDLGQDFMQKTGWTTRGRREDRRGGSNKRTGTHLRYRQYLAGAAYTVALTLRQPSATPGLDDIEQALTRPERPLFIGRKVCLPAARLAAGRTRADSVLAALRTWPTGAVEDSPVTLEAWWPGDLEVSDEDETLTITDRRDWTNQIHTGQRSVQHGYISVAASETDE